MPEMPTQRRWSEGGNQQHIKRKYPVRCYLCGTQTTPVVIAHSTRPGEAIYDLYRSHYMRTHYQPHE